MRWLVYVSTDRDTSSLHHGKQIHVEVKVPYLFPSLTGYAYVYITLGLEQLSLPVNHSVVLSQAR